MGAEMDIEVLASIQEQKDAEGGGAAEWKCIHLNVLVVQLLLSQPLMSFHSWDKALHLWTSVCPPRKCEGIGWAQVGLSLGSVILGLRDKAKSRDPKRNRDRDHEGDGDNSPCPLLPRANSCDPSPWQLY